MAFDGITLSAVVRELSIFKGLRVAKISQPDNHSIILTFKTEMGNKRLFMSANPSLPLLYVTDTNRQSPDAAPSFCMVLRKHMQGARIEDIIQPGLERAVRISFRHSDEMGDIQTYTLVTELMGKHSNIILTGNDDKVIDAIRHVPPSMSSVRTVLPGTTYFLPETKGKSDFLTTSAEAFMRSLSSSPLPISSFLNASYQGISRVAAEEVCNRAGISPDSLQETLSPSDMSSVYLAVKGLIEEASSGKISPVIYMEKGKPVEFSPVPLTTCAGMESFTCSGISEAMISFYSEKERISRIKQRGSDIKKAVSSLLAKDVKKLSLQEKQLKDTEKADTLRTYGELLLIYGYSIQPGDKTLTAEDYRTGEEIKIPLDTTLTFKQNANRYFARYDKLKRTRENLLKLTEDVKKEIELLETISQAIDMAENDADLTDIRRELADYGFIKMSPDSKGRKRSGNASQSEPLHYLSRDGHHIYVGKNNRQNDQLTFSLARPEDYWFHAKGVPGSHVILKVNENEDTPSDSAFEDAAALAVHYSRLKDLDKGEVDYVKKREVKKPKGSFAGFVVYYTNYSMVMSSDISALTQV
ncbi:MAG: NFACT family protein [Lachnospiraceae bacterium]|nr:NFACT family protein [Lachnospiraceae bacterium]